MQVLNHRSPTKRRQRFELIPLANVLFHHYDIIVINIKRDSHSTHYNSFMVGTSAYVIINLAKSICCLYAAKYKY